MSNEHNSPTDPDRSTIYQIRVKGHLGSQWCERFAGLSISLEEDGSTLLSGPVVDQAALFGLLRKVRDSGMFLLSVNRVESNESGENESDNSFR